MSYDITIQVEHAEIWYGSPTYNFGPMLREAFKTNSLENGIKDLNGMRAGWVAQLLDDAIFHMRQHPEVYKPLEAENGWGTYEQCIEFLEEFRQQCQRVPKHGMVIV